MNAKRELAISSISPQLVSSLSRASAVPDRLVEVFRDLILTGEWKPGSPIVETAIAKAVGVSQPTVREALKHLEAEGLILRRQYRSCEVTRLSREEVDQIFRLRIEWEALAAELAVENRGKWVPDQLAAAAERLKEAARKHDTDAFYRYDLEFHKTLWGVVPDYDTLVRLLDGAAFAGVRSRSGEASRSARTDRAGCHFGRQEAGAQRDSTRDAGVLA